MLLSELKIKVDLALALQGDLNIEMADGADVTFAGTVNDAFVISDPGTAEGPGNDVRQYAIVCHSYGKNEEAAIENMTRRLNEGTDPDIIKQI